MNYPTLQKMTLTATTLLTSFALSAHGGSAKVSSALQTNGSNRSMSPFHRLLSPASTYMIDDGTAEDSIQFSNGVQNLEALWFNQFDVILGQETIASVSVAWGSPLFPDNINGTPVIIAIWSDPNGDGNPSDAVLLGSTSGTIVNAETDTFVTYPFSPPVTLPPGATSFFVGDMTPMNNGPVHYIQAIDENSVLFRQSWVAAMSDGSPVDINNVGSNDFLGIIDDFGISGNWLIRADAGDGSDNITLTATIHKQQGKSFVVLTWTPADGGSVNVMRNGSVIATTDNDGSGQDSVEGFAGVLVYQVCDADGSGCSNQVRLRIKPHAD
jgi:hypothetical protein